MPVEIRKPELDISTVVTTPEHVSFEYKLAGLTRRLPAFLLDVTIRAVFLISLIVFMSCSGVFVGLPFGFAYVFAALLLFYFFLSWFYGAFFEYYWNGQTPGKYCLRIRTVMADGHPINGVAALVRNLCRTADIMPIYLLPIGEDLEIDSFPVPLFLFAGICMCLTKRFQRLGDIAANTIVIVEETDFANRLHGVRDEHIEEIARNLPVGLMLKPSLVQTLALYVDRRLFLSLGQREDLAAILLSPLRQIHDFPKDISGDQLLCAMHYREFYLQAEKIDLDFAEV